MKFFPLGAAALAVAAATSPAAAKDHIVQMKNMGAAGAMVFESRAGGTAARAPTPAARRPAPAAQAPRPP